MKSKSIVLLVVLLIVVATTAIAAAGVVNPGGSEAVAAPPVPGPANVQVVNTVDSPVPVLDMKTSNEIRTPAQVTLTASFDAGVTSMSDYKAVSDDQWFVVQAISVDGECPAGQKFWGCRLWTDQRFSTDAASRVVVNPNGSCDRGDGTQYCFMDVVPCELYLAPSAGFHVDAHRNGSTGTAQLNVYLSGYLTNQAQITN